ncbi:mechanosensitive ion channel family protein [Acuticoccus sp. MNP-M23]|uniref:mechanosensitive ion channel family protein n=1 Tax=Acuticoccus sp. MNP-M23 TaxID=3072793 RepID=UPI0028154A21|nr:mechanosensitive ion channel family protein [Acuticoccus sp. MNP-M23]WMS42550.1 mechanosensitive ion channel family protein [Acuticoccus sp. MNP-M23]
MARRTIGTLLLALACIAAVAHASAQAQDTEQSPASEPATVSDRTVAPAVQPTVQANGVVDPLDTISPLSPAPVSSPRQTFVSFRSLAQGAADSLMAAFDVSADNDAIFDTPEVLELKDQALDRLARATTTLDLSQVPPATRRTVGVNSVLLLEEVMDRIVLPDLASIPGSAEVAEGAAATGWTVPGTQIRMVRSESPSGEPEFRFSPSTLQALPEYYALVQDSPRLSADAIDFYQHFVTGPGLSTPIELYRYVLQLPPAMLKNYYEQALWQWIALVVITAVTAALVAGLLRWEVRRAQSISPLRRAFHRVFVPLLIIATLSIYHWVVDEIINLTGAVLASFELAIELADAFAFALLAVFLFNLVAALVIASPRFKQESLDASLIRLLLRVIGIIFAGYILFLGARDVGIPVYGIVAGLGVGGLAIALAVRPTLENFIGGIILYADRPVKVGDFCMFGDQLGTVEAIGLRSTKVRGLDRTLMTVQNSDFAQMSITNFTRRDSNLVHTTVGLRYGTTPAQMTDVCAGLEAMLKADDRVKDDTVRVVFRSFGEYALNVEIWAYVKSADWTEFLRIQQELLIGVLKTVEESGSSFALPSQINYVTGDTPNTGGTAPAGPGAGPPELFSQLAAAGRR